MKSFLLLCVFLLSAAYVSAQSADVDLRVFPNPVATQFEIGASESVATVHVINMIGRELKQFAYTTGTTYDIAALPQGMYIVQLRDRDEKVLHTQRIKKS